MRILVTLAGAVLALALTAATAGAADPYTSSGGGLKDGTAPALPPTWTGVYGYAGIGGHFVDHALEVPGVLTFDGIAGTGFTGTFGGGGDIQLGKLVIGVFGSYDIPTAQTTLDVGPLSASVDLNSLWTVGGRAGVLVTPSTLLGVLVGYSEAEFEAKAPGGSIKITASGITLGGFVEQQLGSGFAVRGEYRHTELDPQGVSSFLNVETDIDAVYLVGVYRFSVGHNPLN